MRKSTRPTAENAVHDAIADAIIATLGDDLRRHIGGMGEFAHLRRLAITAAALLGVVFVLLAVFRVPTTLLVGTFLAAAGLVYYSRPARGALGGDPVRVSVRLMLFQGVSVDRHRCLILEHSGAVPPTPLEWRTLPNEMSLQAINQRLHELLERLPAFLSTDQRTGHQWTSAEAQRLTGPEFELLGVEGEFESLIRDLATRIGDAPQVRASIHAVGPQDPLLPKAQLAIPAYMLEGSWLTSTRQESGRSGAEALQSDVLVERPLEAELEETVHILQALATQLSKKRNQACRSDLHELTESQLYGLQGCNLTYLCPACNKPFLDALAEPGFRYVSATRVPEPRLTAVMEWVEDRATWTCGLCGVDHQSPIPVPRLLVECCLPAFSKMMTEHHVARQAVYSDIENQKRQYANEAEKEVVSRHDAHRRDMNQLMMKSREIVAQAKALEAKRSSLGALMATWKLIKEQRLREVEAGARAIVATVAASQQAFERRYTAANREIVRDAVASINQRAMLARRETQAQFALLGRIAGATERTARATETSAAVQLAFAHETGLLKPAWWNVAGRISYAVEDLGRHLTGRSLVGQFLGEEAGPQRHGRAELAGQSSVGTLLARGGGP